MKKIPVALLFLVIAFFAPAQSWQWGIYGNRTYQTEGYGMAMDKSANLFLTGEYSDSLAFMPYVFTSNGLDCFIVKYDSSGNLKWANSPRSTDYSVGLSVASDSSGNALMVGYFQGNLTAGTHILSSGSTAAPFLIKYNASGTVLWARQGTIPGGNYSYGTSTATDLKGNVFITGFFSDSIIFGPYKLKALSRDLFLVKYDSLGNVLWAKQPLGLDSTGSINGFASVATDLQGNAYVTNGFNGKLSFGSYILKDSLGADVFLAKYDTGGNVLWAEQTTVPSHKSTGLGVSVIADASDNVYITGQIKDTVSFGPFTLATASYRKSEVFLAKYDRNGNPLWAEESTSNYGFGWSGYSVAVDNSNGVYITAGTQNLTNQNPVISFGLDTFRLNNKPLDPAILVKFDSNGKVLCGSIINSGGDDQNAVAADPTGKYIYMGGDIASIDSSTIFGQDTINPSFTGGLEYPFIARWNPCVKDEETFSAEIRNAQNTISIYPNPCSTTLNIDLASPAEGITKEGKLTMQITDITGRVLSTYNLRLTTYDYSLDVSYLAPGMYFLRLNSGTGTEVKKFIKSY